ncbi:thiamine-phosphate kinase [Thalassotalea mangrovi]|uniref:Thiamine-monophosphate kinase n=1 Tax=Thalassotalea mangrovi TaxID=2572245 RepID=A0A4U1B5Y6_9GAMM|nr:thiamine-phosphate kinase [Thalassotalea mangrovi]TKB45162.1 thiamine-phosphate kinase [Thalassotalea mangrovi]
MKEFEVIREFFTAQPVSRKDVAMGIGDDCALIQANNDKYIAITTDTLVAGVHFPNDASARSIGHKAVAVNLSDLAAMGAEPCWISVAVTLPEVDTEWLREFTAGIFELTEYFNVQLIGGDTTSGPLSITITAQGTVPQGKALCRNGAANGDWVYITGDVGKAGLALQAIRNQVELSPREKNAVMEALNYPKPQVLAGQIIREYASAAIDISDGLLADVTHLCRASKLGVNIDVNDIPIAEVLIDKLGEEGAARLALTAGDDYQLIFTVSDTNKVALETELSHANIKISCIGQMNKSEQINITRGDTSLSFSESGFEHFS